MSDYTPDAPIVIRQLEKYTVEFEIRQHSVSGANDGTIDPDQTVSSAIAKIYTQNGTDITTDILDTTATVSSNVVTFRLKYPEENGKGDYKLRIILTLSPSNDVLNTSGNDIHVRDYSWE